MNELNGKIALVTGASRGIGAATSRILASRGADVIINYRSKGPRAEEVAHEIEAMGRKAFLAQADITDAEQMAAAMNAIGVEVGRIDLLILNASGGLEKGKEEDYAMQLNLTAQVRAVDLALPLMPQGSRIVFVTSHLAHFHGEKPVMDAYEVVAASKKAGENALVARIPEFEARGISLVIVSGDMIDGTITIKMLERANRGSIEQRRQDVGSLPTVEEFAHEIVNAAGDASLESGHVVFVGSTD